MYGGGSRWAGVGAGGAGERVCEGRQGVCVCVRVGGAGGGGGEGGDVWEQVSGCVGAGGGAGQGWGCVVECRMCNGAEKGKPGTSGDEVITHSLSNLTNPSPSFSSPLSSPFITLPSQVFLHCEQEVPYCSQVGGRGRQSGWV